MAGIYIHIPFCKQRCSYCDFHFSTSLKHKSSLVHAITQELEQKKALLNDPIHTIYFGGGTPSLLDEQELLLLVDTVNKHYTVSKEIEFTLECNPDDVTTEKLINWTNAGVNRLSIGVQSFFDQDLTFFNRAHNAEEAKRSILLSQEKGINNITVDLIYGIPGLTIARWEENLEKFHQLNIPHLSAYALTVEPKTALFHQVKTNLVKPPDDNRVVEQFQLLLRRTKDMGLIQYEISNFGKEHYFSKHNSNYWKGVPYIGIGPSAHSFVNNTRMWNVANNHKYVKALTQNLSYYEEEIIDSNTTYNEYILTNLRTMWGIDSRFIANTFEPTINQHFQRELSKYIDSPYLRKKDAFFFLTEKGLFIADKISADLFYTP